MMPVKMLNSDHIEPAELHSAKGYMQPGFVARCPYRGCSWESEFLEDRGVAEARQREHKEGHR